MNKNIELEYRVEIPIGGFEKEKTSLSKNSKIISHVKRIALMIFVSKNNSTSILYIRTTKNKKTDELDCEIVHKKGSQHSHDRTEVTQKIKREELEKFIKLFSNFVSDKKILMQRETINFETENDINIALVKARKHAYIEFEKICNEKEKNAVEKEVLSFIQKHKYNILDEKSSNDLFKRLDEIDDMKMEGEGEEIKEIMNLLEEF